MDSPLRDKYDKAIRIGFQNLIEILEWVAQQSDPILNVSDTKKELVLCIEHLEALKKAYPDDPNWTTATEKILTCMLDLLTTLWDKLG